MSLRVQPLRPIQILVIAEFTGAFILPANAVHQNLMNAFHKRQSNRVSLQLRLDASQSNPIVYNLLNVFSLFRRLRNSGLMLIDLINSRLRPFQTGRQDRFRHG